jgi:thiol:disulfide interchange protein
MARIRDQRTVPIVLIAIAVLLVAGRVASLVVKPAGAKAAVQWVSIEEGVMLARASNKPLMLYFTAAWCAPCHQLEADVFAKPELAAEINDKFIAVKVVDRQREDGQNTPDVASLEQRFNVRGFPTIQFVNPNGNELARMEGFTGRAEFERVMESAIR